ncbi:MAG: response regulator [Bdellovibrionales bacterium]|nr:response regulator [Bdellovibrionales bacterium]
MGGIEVGSKSLSVAVFDDQAAIRDVIKRILELSGHTVWESERADVSRSHLKPFDLAIIDLEMPGNSNDLAQYFKEKGVPVIRCSSYEACDIPEEARGVCHLRKPFRLEELNAAVKAAAGKR